MMLASDPGSLAPISQGITRETKRHTDKHPVSKDHAAVHIQHSTQ